VIFAGQVPHAQIGGYLAAMDVAVAPYRAPGPGEGDFYFSPLKVFEYLAAGKPVVAPRLGQIAGILAEGRCGALYPPDDVAALATHLRTLANDPALRASLGRAGAALVRERYTWAGNAAQVAQLARRLMAMRGAAVGASP
jgi:glycosyltransferase involved in cell wall biosynthesis